MENDKNFNFLFNEAFEKIPWLFRFSRRRYKAAIIVMIVSFVIMLIMTTVFYNSVQTEMVPSALPLTTVGSYTAVNTYEYRWLIPVFVFAGIAVVISGWILISRELEKRAFRKAADLSNRIFLSERHRMEVEWQNWKMENRDY